MCGDDTTYDVQVNVHTLRSVQFYHYLLGFVYPDAPPTTPYRRMDDQHPKVAVTATLNEAASHIADLESRRNALVTLHTRLTT